MSDACEMLMKALNDQHSAHLHADTAGTAPLQELEAHLKRINAGKGPGIIVHGVKVDSAFLAQTLTRLAAMCSTAIPLVLALQPIKVHQGVQARVCGLSRVYALMRGILQTLVSPRSGYIHRGYHCSNFNGPQRQLRCGPSILHCVSWPDDADWRARQSITVTLQTFYVVGCCTVQQKAGRSCHARKPSSPSRSRSAAAQPPQTTVPTVGWSPVTSPTAPDPLPEHIGLRSSSPCARTWHF